MNQTGCGRNGQGLFQGVIQPLHERTKENYENCQYSLSLGPDSKPRPPEYESGALNTRQQR